MDKLLLTDWFLIITGIGTIVALIGNVRSMQDKGQNQAAVDAELRSDVKHIRETVDKMDDLPGRMIRVEESSKQAHKRIDQNTKDISELKNRK